MDDAFETQPPDFVTLTGDVVSAYVSNNSIRPNDLAELIGSIHQALLGLGQPAVPAEEKHERATPTQIRKSVTPDALISFEDGKAYKTLRRHLTIRGLTPEAYRSKYGLPVDYPMTSANYSAQRSALAQSLGLGRHRQDTKARTAKIELVEDVQAPATPPTRGRPRKAAAKLAAK